MPFADRLFSISLTIYNVRSKNFLLQNNENSPHLQTFCTLIAGFIYKKTAFVSGSFLNFLRPTAGILF